MKTNLNQKKLALISHGFRPSIITAMNERQINVLHDRLLEQVTQIPSKPTYKIGDKGGTIPNNPTGKGYAIKQNPDKTVVAVPMDEEEDINEKAISKKQQEFFGIVRAMQKGDLPKKGKAGKVSKEISKKDAEDFAETKHKGLPTRVKKETKENYLDMVGKAFNKNMGNKIADIKPSLKWESILEDEFSRIIESVLFPKMTKKDFIKTIMESPEETNEETNDGLRFFMTQVKKNRMLKK
jgi:hypothetical protein